VLAHEAMQRRRLRVVWRGVLSNRGRCGARRHAPPASKRRFGLSGPELQEKRASAGEVAAAWRPCPPGRVRVEAPMQPCTAGQARLSPRLVGLALAEEPMIAIAPVWAAHVGFDRSAAREGAKAHVVGVKGRRAGLDGESATHNMTEATRMASLPPTSSQTAAYAPIAVNRGISEARHVRQTLLERRGRPATTSSSSMRRARSWLASRASRSSCSRAVARSSRGAAHRPRPSDLRLGRSPSRFSPPTLEPAHRWPPRHASVKG